MSSAQKTVLGDADPLNPGFRLGYVVTTITSDHDAVRAIALQNDGKIIVAGNYYSGRAIGFVVRYNANGTLDSGFGSVGRVILDFGKRLPSPFYDVAVQVDGRLDADAPEIERRYRGSHLALYYAFSNPQRTKRSTGAGSARVPACSSAQAKSFHVTCHHAKRVYLSRS